jgi:enoyl-CoA hydratase/carnithine racemase
MSDLHISREGHVGLIVIDRPPNNHVSVELIAAIASALVASEGKVFCGGADLSGNQPGGIAGQLYQQAERLFRTRKPIVAAVQGAAVGAGLGLALAADFRVAAAEARFSANFAKLGFHSGFAISLTLPRVVGLQAANLLLLTGRRVSGEEALTMGLADQLEPFDQVRPATMALAAEIAGNAPLAVEAMRATLRQGLADAVRAQMAHELDQQTAQRGTADFAEGVRAVAERRPGRFTRA